MPPEEGDHHHHHHHHALSEPLLSNNDDEEESGYCPEEDDNTLPLRDEEEEEQAPTIIHASSSDQDEANDVEESFSTQRELWEMFELGFPLAVSFFCRMGMASTDSSFVGHLNDGVHDAGTYLAAAVLSDMCLSILITPPLAFNQVLNALVGQAVGSGNPRMAGIWLQQSCFWLTITCLPCLIGLFYVQTILEWLDFPETVAAVAGKYAKYNVLWPVPNGLYQCARFFFQAQGLPRPAMYNNLAFLFINALLNWTFCFGGPFRYYYGWHGFGFVGAAISLSISRTMQSVVYFWYMFVYKQYHKPTWPVMSPTTTGGGWWSYLLQHHTRARTVEFLKQSVPNLGTLIFQSVSSQATTMLVGRLGQVSIAASAVLSTITIPWSGSLDATCSTVSSVRVGYHLGRGNAHAAQRASWLILVFITVMCILFSALFGSSWIRPYILRVATNDEAVLELVNTVVPALLVGTYLNLLVSNVTSGVFGGQGRPLITTLLSLGLELPLSIGGIAIYILVLKGDSLVNVYWWKAISGGLEAVIVLVILLCFTNWQTCADQAQQRQESDGNTSSNDNSNTPGAPTTATTNSTDEEEQPASRNISCSVADDDHGVVDLERPLLPQDEAQYERR